MKHLNYYALDLVAVFLKNTRLFPRLWLPVFMQSKANRLQAHLTLGKKKKIK